MTNFGSTSYTPGIKRLVPNYSKLKRDAITLMSSIIYEINNDFIDACLKNNGKSKDITPKHVKESIKHIIPEGLRRYAFAAGNCEVQKYMSGTLHYNIQDQSQKNNLDQRMLKKGLERLAKAVNDDLTLAKGSAAIVTIIQKLALHMAEQFIATIGDKSELSLRDMKNTVCRLLGEEMFQHAEGHAESNLEWYRSGNLEFALKPISTETKEIEPEVKTQNFAKHIQKFSKHQFMATVPKDTSMRFEQILNNLMNAILESVNTEFQKIISDNPNASISDELLIEAARNILPETLFHNAQSNAHSTILNYACGLLKYKYEKKSEKDSTKRESQEKKIVVPNFRKGLKHLMEVSNCSSERGFLQSMNDILNDIGSAIAERSVESARRNDNVLSKNDMLVALDDLLPNDLKQHALARTAHILSEVSQQNMQFQANNPMLPTSREVGLELGQSEDHSVQEVEIHETTSVYLEPETMEIREMQDETLNSKMDSVKTHVDMKSNTSIESSVVQKANSISSISRNGNDSKREIIFLDIPKQIYWLDVRPYDMYS